ncbi:unnamed protein product [Urochloa humidicola]
MDLELRKGRRWWMSQRASPRRPCSRRRLGLPRAAGWGGGTVLEPEPPTGGKKRSPAHKLCRRARSGHPPVEAAGGPAVARRAGLRRLASCRDPARRRAPPSRGRPRSSLALPPALGLDLGMAPLDLANAQLVVLNAASLLASSVPTSSRRPLFLPHQQEGLRGRRMAPTAGSRVESLVGRAPPPRPCAKEEVEVPRRGGSGAPPGPDPPRRGSRTRARRRRPLLPLELLLCS